MFVISPTLREDSRGFFARAWCEKEFSSMGLPNRFPQCNISFNKKRGTIRAIHYTIKPSQESKLVRCTRGSIFDVVVDLRPQSATFLKWYSFELTAENRTQLFIPQGLGHGFQTLEDQTEVFYHMGDFYDPALSKGIRYDDSELGIRWPIAEVIISEQDLSSPTVDQSLRQLCVSL